MTPTAAPEGTGAGRGFALGAFVRSAGVLSISSVANFARAIITAKLFAVTLGPSAVGILSQLLNFSALLSTLVALGLSTGVVKVAAESARDGRRAGLATGTAAILSLASAAVTAAVLAPVAGQVSTALTGRPAYAGLVVLIVASFPLYNLAGVLGYVLQGLTEISLLTAANVATAVLSILSLVPLSILYGLSGAIVSVLITSFAQAAVFLAACVLAFRRRRWTWSVLGLDRTLARTYLGYGGIVLLGGLASWAALLVVRTLLVRQLGDSANGLYQVAYGLSNQYVTVFMTWMAAYVFPRLAAESVPGRLGGLLNSALRANLLIMVPVIGFSVALRVPLIHLLYSASFVPAEPLVPLQALGDYARVVGWTFGVSLFARGHTRAHLLVITSQAVAWVAASWLLLPVAGIDAAPAGYLLSFLLYPALCLPMAARWFNARLDALTLGLTVAGLAAVLAACYLPAAAGIAASTLVAAAVYLADRRRARPPAAA